ncbi:MAG: DUF2163 domain-containing protein [Pseudolabrys sp.]|nr:DUF2163 domain-containing protein [Pseudolabrys sp.]
MRTLPPALQDKLNSGVTTLCRCWLIARNDGVTQGFTDHDEDVVVGNIVCRAGSGLSASEATQRLGLAVDGMELSGALCDESLNESDLAAGRYDAAAVELWLVDWSEPRLRVLVAKGTLGEVRRAGRAFTAELRGVAQPLAQQTGRFYTTSCAADLGDARCGIDLALPAHRGAGAIAALLSASSFRASGLDAFADGWFTAGRLEFTGGANRGLAVEIKIHRKDEAVTLDLWQAMPEPIAVGDAFVVTAGCDKRFGTCCDKFNNAVNFRGFPHIPGNDFVFSYPTQGAAGNDGESLQS